MLEFRGSGTVTADENGWASVVVTCVVPVAFHGEEGKLSVGAASVAVSGVVAAKPELGLAKGGITKPDDADGCGEVAIASVSDEIAVALDGGPVLEKSGRADDTDGGGEVATGSVSVKGVVEFKLALEEAAA